MYMNVHTECIYRINEEILNDDRRFEVITRNEVKNLDQLKYLRSFSVVMDCPKYNGSIPSAPQLVKKTLMEPINS